MIQLKYANLIKTAAGCRTTFRDGSHVDAVPHNTPHYYVIAHRGGYGDDVLAYCRAHEFCHEFLAEKIFDQPSDVLWELAHGRRADNGIVIQEEMATQMFQRWLHANERPIVSGGCWDGWKAEALSLLAKDTSDAT